MFTDRLNEAFNEASKRHDIAVAKIDAYCEATMDMYHINCAKAREKVMVEDGTAEDLMYLQEEADNSALEKLKKAIDKIIEAFKKFCNEIKIKVMTMLKSKETEENLDRAEKKIKLNPFLAKKKVDIENSEKKLAVVEWVHAQQRKLVAKIKSGRTVDTEDVIELNDEAEDKYNKAIKTSKVVITVGALMAFIRSKVKVFEKEAKEQQDRGEDLAEECKKNFSEELGGQVSSVLRQIGSDSVNWAKRAIRILMDTITEGIAKIKSTVSKASGNKEDTQMESADDLYNGNYTLTESSFLDEIENELFSESQDDDDIGDFDSWMAESSDGDFSFEF